MLSRSFSVALNIKLIDSVIERVFYPAGKRKRRVNIEFTDCAEQHLPLMFSREI